LTAADLTKRTAKEIRDLAAAKGYKPYGKPDAAGKYRKFRDPKTKEGVRIDEGHKDAAGNPFRDPRAAVPHAHGYGPGEKPIVDPATGNKHFPLK
jgi:hypothetical protein